MLGSSCKQERLAVWSETSDQSLGVFFLVCVFPLDSGIYLLYN